jgi:Cys-rich repeat protein
MPLESGKAFTLTWTPGTVADARITLEFDLSHHGGSKGQIRCETADSTGSLTVSGTLIKSLVDLGVTGYPWLTIARVSKGTAPVGAGQAQLKVYSDDKLILEVPGIKSCNDDSVCPSGQTCLIPSYMCGVACKANSDCPTGQTCQTTSKTCK